MRNSPSKQIMQIEWVFFFWIQKANNMPWLQIVFRHSHNILIKCKVLDMQNNILWSLFLCFSVWALEKKVYVPKFPEEKVT